MKRVQIKCDVRKHARRNMESSYFMAKKYLIHHDGGIVKIAHRSKAVEMKICTYNFIMRQGKIL